MGVGAVALGDRHDFFNFRMGQAPGIDTLDPGAEGAGQAQFLGLAQQTGWIIMIDEAVIQVQGRVARGQSDLHGDGGEYAQVFDHAPNYNGLTTRAQLAGQKGMITHLDLFKPLGNGLGRGVKVALVVPRQRIEEYQFGVQAVACHLCSG